MKIFAAAWLMMVMLPILSDNAMDDKQQIEALYREMYEAMVRKDTAAMYYNENGVRNAVR